MNDKKKSPKFPFRRCFSATLVLIIVSSMLLVLLISIAKSAGDDEVANILLIIILSISGAFLVGYWIYQISLYFANLHDENEKKN